MLVQEKRARDGREHPDNQPTWQPKHRPAEREGEQGVDDAECMLRGHNGAEPVAQHRERARDKYRVSRRSTQAKVEPVPTDQVPAGLNVPLAIRIQQRRNEGGKSDSNAARYDDHEHSRRKRLT